MSTRSDTHTALAPALSQGQREQSANSDSELSEGWVSARISDLFDCWGGMTPSTSNRAYWGGKTPWISSKDVKTPRLQCGTEFVTERALAETRLRKCRPGSVLVVVRSGVLAHTLPVAVADREVVVNQDLKALDSGNTMLNEWLALYLRAHGQAILEANRKEGTTVQSVRVDQLLSRDVLLPPLVEQQRIVAQVERLLARVNAARERLAKVPAILKRFRQAALAAACSGRLTEEWPAHSPEEWQEVLFGDLISEGPQNGIYKPQSEYGEGRLIVRIDDFHDGLLKAWPQLRRVRLQELEAGKYALREHDILINRVNSLKFLGKSVLVPRPVEQTVFESNMMRCSLDRCRVAPAFAALYLRSLRGMEELRKNAKHAVNQSSINQDDVREVPFLVPPMPEQHEIVRRVDALFKLADTIELRVKAATARAERLTHAILGKAFRGELVPTEAELAGRDGRDYESAAVLLERIRAQRAERQPSPRPSPRGRGRKSGGERHVVKERKKRSA